MPYLVCDEPDALEQVTYYTVRGLGNGGFADPARVPSDPGEYGFKLDLSTLKPGAYTIKANACNEWSCSVDSSPFDFSVPGNPSIPVGLRIL
jgi:hypothetical protein